MNELKRTIGLSTAISVVVGIIIGSGIFMKPAVMAAQLGSPLLLLSVWAVAGIISLFGALTNAEAAAMFPETGGQLIFFEKMYGNGFAFMYGWAAFAVFSTAANASVLFICAQYMNYFLHLPHLPEVTEHAVCLHLPCIGNIFPLENLGVKLLTILMLILITAVNYVSVRFSASLERFLTVLKVLAITFLIIGVFFSKTGSVDNIITPVANLPQGFALVSAYMAAIAGAFWAYEGWNTLTFIGGEIKDPQKNIPKSLFTGLLLCMGIYLLVNLAFMYEMPVGKMAASSFVASDAAGAVWGTTGAGLVAGMVILSTLGSSDAGILAKARVTYALADTSSFFAWAGKTQSRYNTPGNALLLNAVWSCVLIMSGSFHMLTNMLIFMTWLFYGMSALGIFILRRKMKEVPRPYKVFGYPVVPFIFILFTVFFLVVTLYTDITSYMQGKTHTINSLFSIAITSLGLPIYFFTRKRAKPLKPNDV